MVPEIGVVPEFFNLAFTLEDNRVSEPLHTFEASFVLKVVGREKPYIPEFSDADVKKLAEEKAQEEKDLASSSKKFEDVGKELGQGSTNLDSVAKKLGLEVKHTPLFNRSDSIPGIGNIQGIKAAAKMGGTKIPEALAPVLATASATVLNTGRPRCSMPPLSGVTPPTRLVP